MLREAGLLAYIVRGTRVSGESAQASEFARMIPVEFVGTRQFVVLLPIEAALLRTTWPAPSDPVPWSPNLLPPRSVSEDQVGVQLLSTAGPQETERIAALYAARLKELRKL
ncbi:hypothetical protein [Streptomyces sp. NPDC020298]|uniref:hypothetical protein n=1 Tax=unclassified Streptomyces TaxID=2593676 RepID=UPI0033F06F12